MARQSGSERWGGQAGAAGRAKASRNAQSRRIRRAGAKKTGTLPF